jgi:hypothetical protein
MKTIKIFIALFLMVQSIGAQTMNIVEEPMIQQMMARFKELNKAEKNISGWRIQLTATTDRKQMEEVLRSFENKYPDTPLNWVHAKPYYQLRVGAFATRMESLKLLSKVKTDFPSAFPAQDNTIRTAELSTIKVK